MRAGHRVVPMTALLQVDVTEAWKRLHDKDLSPTAFVIACVGRAVAEHPEVHAYRDWWGRLVMHEHVDIATMIDIETSSGRFPLAHTIVDTDTRSVAEISDELHRVRDAPSQGRGGRLMLRWGSSVTRIPGLISFMYFISRRSRLVRSGVGTVAVSAIGMMLGGNGFGIGLPTIASLSVTVGGVTERPWVVDGEVEARQILDLCLQVDHRVVDGAPAARCAATLRTLLEDPSLVSW